MAYDHAEEEQLASLKAWWKQYGNLVTWLLIIVLAAYAAWAGWGVYQRNQSAQAAQLYEELQKAVTAQDKDKIQRVATDMQEKFSSTAYAQMSGLAAAKSAFDANDLKTAKAQLQWVADKGSDAYKAIAKIRLAGILLDEKAYDEGLKVLSGDFPAEFAGVVSDRKGDIYVAQNKLDEARTAYQTALEKTDAQNPGRQLIQIKLDAIGGAAVKKAA
ncbi:tetratricopeptide repeat protein [Herminiimonas aquatilis]|uniref:Tetratricopeptide repeat protein n=1 Tax=Herminiimonas aquatilis TaxID=345342 RepID=A0ABW2J7N2_9BURK